MKVTRGIRQIGALTMALFMLLTFLPSMGVGSLAAPQNDIALNKNGDNVRANAGNGTAYKAFTTANGNHQNDSWLSGSLNNISGKVAVLAVDLGDYYTITSASVHGTAEYGTDNGGWPSRQQYFTLQGSCYGREEGSTGLLDVDKDSENYTNISARTNEQVQRVANASIFSGTVARYVRILVDQVGNGTNDEALIGRFVINVDDPPDGWTPPEPPASPTPHPYGPWEYSPSDHIIAQPGIRSGFLFRDDNDGGNNGGYNNGGSGQPTFAQAGYNRMFTPWAYWDGDGGDGSNRQGSFMRIQNMDTTQHTYNLSYLLSPNPFQSKAI